MSDSLALRRGGGYCHWPRPGLPCIRDHSRPWEVKRCSAVRFQPGCVVDSGEGVRLFVWGSGRLRLLYVDWFVWGLGKLGVQRRWRVEL